MRLRSLLAVASAAVIAAITACGDDGGVVAGASPDAGEGPDAFAPVDAGDPKGDVPLVPASKVDILFAVDNSASMGDKAQLLATSVGTLVQELAKTNDLHIAVVTSSLGTMGGDVCPDEGYFNLYAHLKTSSDAPNGVLEYHGGDAAATIAATQSLIKSVGQSGCGFEAQLESMYRFLVQPDPWKSVKLDGFNQADLGADGDVDESVLAQRKAFLRPDSALVVVMLTDEDDSSADPLSVGGQGWAYMARSFPGSMVYRGDPRNGTTAPRGTSACTDPARGPGHPDCTSCGFAAVCNAADPACQKIKQDPNCNDTYGGYYGPTDDNLNVRFHRMKERYGIDPQFPLSRYVDGLTYALVPKRSEEHPSTPRATGGRDIAAYSGVGTCTNPIFAATLPGSASEELCTLPRGPRSRQLVLFAILGGVPEPLATATPNWSAIVGANPDAYDETGIDPHMIQSVTPRATLAPPSDTRGDNGPDPIHGREWTTSKGDLQFACTFALPVTRTCTSQDPSCDCADPNSNPPLCGATLGEQLRGKAYPTLRPLRVARALAERGVIGSICANAGYDATMKTLADRITPLLAK